MAVTDVSFNGSVATIGASNFGPLTEFRHADDPATFDTTGASASAHTTGAGRHKHSFTAGFLGSKAPLAGTVANLSATINGSTTTYSYSPACVTRCSLGGRKDGRVEGTLTAVPASTSLTAASLSAPTFTNLDFNGTTFSFNSSSAVNLVSVQIESSAADIDDAGADATMVISSPGIPKGTVTVSVMGGPQYQPKAVGAITIAWACGGTAGSGANFICTGVHDGGTVDGEVTTEHTFEAVYAST